MKTGSQLKRSYFKKKLTNALSKSPLKRGKISKKARRKKGRAENITALKKGLDRIFSVYIRTKYPKRCYTCGKTGPSLQSFQCGHFVSRQYLATRWEEDNCRPQCVGCNLFGNGRPLDFEEHLKKDLGVERVEEMKQSRHRILKLDRQWYESQIAIYKAKIELSTGGLDSTNNLR